MVLSRRGRAILELLLAAALWGFGFVATKWAFEVLSVIDVVFLRFLLASAIGLPFVLFRRGRHSARRKFRLSFVPALLLVGIALFQNWGLQLSTPTKCGFITTLYVIFVPLLEAAITRRRIPWSIWLCVLGALIGTALIIDLGVAPLNIGDVLTFISALIATVQIYWMGSVSPGITQAFTFNVYQCFWTLLMVLPLVSWNSLNGKLHAIGDWPPTVILGLLSLAVGSTLIAFYLQVRAQAQLSRTVSSIMFLLESPFAMIFSLLLLGEHLRPLESFGAFLIFVSAFFATWLEARVKKD